MIDPIIFSFQIFGITIALHWYGVLAMTGLLVGSFIVDREIKRRGGDPEKFWDALVWLAIAGVIGARAWYVVNDILGGGTYFLQDPIRMLLINQGGLHIYGAVVAGFITAYIYLQENRLRFPSVHRFSGAGASGGPSHRANSQLHQSGTIWPPDKSALGYSHFCGTPHSALE